MTVGHKRDSTIVLCDYDGTITLEDTGIAAMRELAPAEGMEVELAWQRGEIDSKECLRREFGLLELTEDEFKAWVLSKPVDPGFESLVRRCRAEGVQLAILSDGLDIYIQWTLDKLGLGDISFAANRGWFEGRRLNVDFPWASLDCGACANCKREHLLRYRERFDRIVYIGDGRSDYCPAAHADILIAKGALARYCMEQGIGFAEFASLADVVTILEREGIFSRNGGVRA